MITRDFCLGAGSALLAIAIMEGFGLVMAFKENRTLKINEIANVAKEDTEKLTDDELRAQLDNELKPR